MLSISQTAVAFGISGVSDMSGLLRVGAPVSQAQITEIALAGGSSPAMLTSSDQGESAAMAARPI
ncbi:hypothetical protein GCM10011342_02980 [Aquisalinus flavus]|uniref:Uncharacterized protein n=1 Tax=Aquisalinus flavus TaxID=1526572 RepID=A0A8J2V479_9PROT|nr:hypothetical protein GCM10011342_02980 [Aquisalinus flavus]